MKKIILVLCVMVFADRLYSQTPSADLAFEERVHNFGKILEKNGKVSHTFVFENKGKKPVTVDDVHSACGCIGKVVTKGPVKPGQKGKVTITFDPSYKSGFFSKEIVVLSNKGQQYNRVWVEGVIEPTEHPVEDEYPYNFGNGLFLRLKVMAFGYLKPGETKQMELHYANATDKEMTLSFAVAGNKQGLQFANPGKIAPKARGVVKFTYTMPTLSVGDAAFTVHPLVNNKKLAEALEVKILNETKLKLSRQTPPKRTN